MIEKIGLDAKHATPRDPFWSINAGQVAVIMALLTFAGEMWNVANQVWSVVNTVETTLENHGQRIAALERELNERHQENASRLDAITKDIGGLARELSVIQGQLMQSPGRRGDIAEPGPGEPQGG